MRFVLNNGLANSRLQYLAGFLATISAFIVGTFIGWASPIKIKMDNGETPLTCSDSNWGWATASPSMGSVIGSIFAGTIADYFGRRWALLLTAPLYLFAWALVYFAENCFLIIISRIIVGIALAIMFPVTSIYIAEIADPKLRGRISAGIMLMHNIGVIFSLIVGPHVDYKTFTIILSAFPIIFFLSFSYMPETPFYRLKCGDRKSATKLMLKYRGLTDEKDVKDQLDTMQAAVDSEMLQKTTLPELIGNGTNRRALLIMLGVKTMQHGSGITAIQSYLQTIFEETNSPIPSDMASIACGVVQLIGGVASGFAIDRLGRKPLLLFSALGTAICLFLVGLFFYLKNIVQVDVTPISWVPFVSVMTFMGFQAFGIGAVTYVLIGELFPTNVKGIATTTVTCYSSIFSSIITKLFSIISSAYDMFAIFWVCCGFMVLGVFFSVFYMIETNGKSLMEIQDELEMKSKKKMVI